jgi:hypothetical protein
MELVGMVTISLQEGDMLPNLTGQEQDLIYIITEQFI